MSSHSGARWRAIPAAVADLTRLGEDDPRLAARAIAVLDLISIGKLQGKPLQDSLLYGDLSDYYKFYFGVSTDATHRIVYRQLVDGAIDVIEVIVVEQREEGYVYLLASHRLGRLPSSTKKAFNRVHQAVIARRGKQRSNKKRQ